MNKPPILCLTLKAISCGVKWAVGFILVYQILFATTYHFTPGATQHLYVSRGHPLAEIAERIMLVVWDYPVGLGMLGLKWGDNDDPFLALLIYVPYLISIQYFVFGFAVRASVGFYRLRRHK